MKKIRKISIGVNPKDALVYVVGGLQLNGTLRVTDIIKEQSGNLFKKSTKYYIWAEYTDPENNSDIFLWYEIENMPTMVQYYC